MTPWRAGRAVLWLVLRPKLVWAIFRMEYRVARFLEEVERGDARRAKVKAEFEALDSPAARRRPIVDSLALAAAARRAKAELFWPPEDTTARPWEDDEL